MSSLEGYTVSASLLVVVSELLNCFEVEHLGFPDPVAPGPGAADCLPAGASKSEMQ